MSRHYIVFVSTALGVLVGGITWLIAYSLNYTSIGFDGPAGGMLGLSMVAGGAFFGIISMIFPIRKVPDSLSKNILVFLASGLVACSVVGLVIIKYSMSKYSDSPQERVGNVSVSRDEARRQHALEMSIGLVTAYLIQKKNVPTNQIGLDTLQRRGTSDGILDPQLNRPYVFNADQSTMQVGEATFRLNATCDDKTEVSKGQGLITDGSSSSVAVAIKLESGSFACETNL
jgi:hypothetical protein